MATRMQPVSVPPPAANLCDYCHQKPKFSNHAFCSKTCATQAAALCNHCHKKPKFQNFDYCGKNCASLANPGGGKPTAAPAPGVRGNGPAGKNNAGARGQPQQQQQAAFDPLQIAKLVVQQMPQVQALLNGAAGGTNGVTTNNAAYAQANGGYAQPQGMPQAAQYAPQPAPMNNPFLNPANVYHSSQQQRNGVQQQQQQKQHHGYQQQHHGQQYQQQPPDDLECLIPGCGKPVHVDAKGLKTSDYCSQRHREEAVASGLVAPCIMCLTRPQSRTDYFCSRTCREESLNKHYEATMDEDNADGDEGDALDDGDAGQDALGLVGQGGAVSSSGGYTVTANVQNGNMNGLAGGLLMNPSAGVGVNGVGGSGAGMGANGKIVGVN
ncbi:hypothetical protein CC1G_11642 [Coprinopsis cinerea okayama7|uniref:Uncharacterized protein n=1 Tax=Coprinopsis cinerea (strain Okayama-7 / 130 / ATCC MYA-4618 / FGSC 9003) TaxID=240176 RepID=A8P486_COPC7|nr:hypothetical protein CC1G_11642 [Coprinopsis cinerea okayama7\|eukprot:XP_001838699.1 hypothetical protein CC1G_11642 [Coprinopsis cinerea okayama7\